MPTLTLIRIIKFMPRNGIEPIPKDLQSSTLPLSYLGLRILGFEPKSNDLKGRGFFPLSYILYIINYFIIYLLDWKAN